MGKKMMTLDVHLTPTRVSRLYRFLTAISSTPQLRTTLLRKLGLDLRGFYRDLETLRALGIDIRADGEGRYALSVPLEDALGRLPLPNPGLNLRDAMQLIRGVSSAQSKLKENLDALLNGKRFKRPNKPR